MFSVESGAYTAPVTTYNDLRDCLPDDPKLHVAPTHHSLTVKTCNAPELLDRCLGSLRETVDLSYIQAVVVDDSKNVTSRQQNMRVANETGAEYCAVSGANSLVYHFGKYIEATESPDQANVLTRYLERIVTDYPAVPSATTWGGVGGAQNLGHLRNIMRFGAEGFSQSEWLSTFIDDDVMMPGNAQEVFRMIGLYHNLGSVSVVASNYLHHSGNPIILATDAFTELAVRAKDMDRQAVEAEVKNIIRRTPTMGLRGSEKSAARYSTPEQTLIFPGGNYSLSGGEAFDLPVPVVGVEDLGYAAMLHLFKGARNLGVARVPDFSHVRYNRPNGGNVNGDLSQFCQAEKDVDYNSFQLIAQEYAASIGVPRENLESFIGLEAGRNQAQARRQAKLSDQLTQLREEPQFANVAPIIEDLQRSVAAFVATKAQYANTLTLDPISTKKLLADMLTLHPRLVDKAYQFGQDGELTTYNQSLRQSTGVQLAA